MSRFWTSGVAIAFGILAVDQRGSAAPREDLSWAFPPLALPVHTGELSQAKTVTLKGASVSQSPAALSDFFHAVDWRPESHPPMPSAVRDGHPPDAFACGYCHLPDGQGRPENAALAGLPAAYIVQQMEDIQSGARHEADPTWRPPEMMVRTARALDADAIAASATYFASQTFTSRVRIQEATMIPPAAADGAVYRFSADKPTEPLGERIVEGPSDFERFEKRDDRVEFLAYVPPGAVGRGQALAETGDHGRTQACESCHGEGLRGQSVGPPLAGRSPSYIFRQLLAFKTGARHGPGGAAMRGVAANLRSSDMIDLAAFTASLPP